MRDLSRLLRCLDEPPVITWIPDQAAALRTALRGATVAEVAGQAQIVRGEVPVGRVLPFGSVVLFLPDPGRPLRDRVLEVDRNGHVTLAVRRGPAGECRGAWVRGGDGTPLGILPWAAGEREHPLWGASDRIVRVEPGREPELLSVCARVAWDAIAVIPPLADPTRLPPGGGSAILNVLASLAQDQAAGSLRYRGPFPTEQLFWALLESFRLEPSEADPLETFLDGLEGAEAAFADAEAREPSLDWIPAPHERLFLDGGAYVQLRDGVEKVMWEGRTYYRTDLAAWSIREPAVRRREHRTVRRITTPEGPKGPRGPKEPKEEVRFVASIEALGRVLEEHLVLDAAGGLREIRAAEAPSPRSAPDVPLAPPWRETLEALSPLEATPLLATAIAEAWRGLRVVWGPVARDLVETDRGTVRLSCRLAEAYRAERMLRPADDRRALATRFVREVLGLVGPLVRRRAAAWLEAEPPARQQALLQASARLDRPAAAARATVPLERLLRALEGDDALPPPPA